MPGAYKPLHGKTSIRGVGPNGPGLNDTFIDPAGGVGADFYDPDQPLWGNDSQSAPALQSVNQSKVKESGLSLDPGLSVDHRVGPFDVPDEHVFKSGGTTIHKTETRENMVPKATPVEKQGQLSNKCNDANSSLKVQSVRKPSQKAQCTLFVNGVPLQQNKRETLISHFHKFGEVINIHIPLNSERAFIQFSKREEAEAALMAPDAVMGNRFIKLWWANHDNIPVDGTVPPVPPRGMPVSSASHNDTIAPVINIPKPPPPSQKKLENLEVLKEELRKKQEMLDQKRNDFCRKLDKLAKQTTSLKGEREPEQEAKKPKLGTVEVIANGNKSLESIVPPQRSKSTAAVLPHEPPVLKPSLRPLPSVGPSVATNRFKLDNRPTAFKIMSTLPNDLANVAVLREHFSQFWDLSKVELDDLEPARVYFRTRHSAEKAFLSGKCWNGHNLQFSWLKSSNHGKDSESQLSTSKGNSDASVGSEKIEQKDINKEETGPR